MPKKMMKQNLRVVGKWAFIGGLVVAIIASFLAGFETTVAILLFVLGLLVGFLNISERDSNKFLLANIALLSGGIASLSAVTVFGTTVNSFLAAILTNFVAFIGAAALVVAIKAIFETGRD